MTTNNYSKSQKLLPFSLFKGLFAQKNQRVGRTLLLFMGLLLGQIGFAQTAPSDDFDGDGIINSLDIDDDNDGVLDFMEQNCPMGTWTDWTSVTSNASATGTLALTSGNITVTYTSPQVYSIQQPGFFNLNDVYNGTMPNSGTEGLQALHGAGTTHTYTFSQPVTNPILVFWSMNGNIFTFTKDFVVLGKTTGITANSRILTGYASECNASIQFIGTFTSISYTSSLLENWTGVTVGSNYCPDRNTDADALANRLDLDSDADGCSDAYEAGATSNLTTDYAFGGAVGTNGLPNAVETVADNGILNYNATYSNFAANSGKSRCNLPNPGGVSTGLAWWYQGDDGVTTSGTAVTNWSDQSANALDLTQATVARQPTNGKYQNFNPVMTFDGGDALSNAVGYWKTSTANTAFNVFAVAKHTNATGSVNALFSEQTSKGPHSVFMEYGGNMYNNLWSSHYVYAPFAATNNVPLLVSTRYNTVGSVNQLLWNSKVQTVTAVGSTGTFNGSSGNLVFGNHPDQASWPYNGDIAEITMYATDLTATQRQQIESYLAIKWGVSLDQMTAYNYLNSSGATIWDATANSTYKNNIVGIGRDNAAGLNQKQAQSINAGIQPVLATTGFAATNQANVTGLGADKSFLIAGSDAGAATFGTAITPPAGSTANNRFTRIWKVQESGTVGTVKLAMPVDFGNGGTAYIVRLTDATFDATDTWIPLSNLTVGGVSYLAGDVDFNTGDYFTFATFITSPGCVAANLNLWLKSDFGISTPSDGSPVYSWSNKSNYGVDSVLQITAGSRPTYYSATEGNLVNFNPSLSFDGGDELYQATRLFNATAPFSMVAMAVDRRTNTAELRAPMGMWYTNGNMPNLDFQTDGNSPNGFNPYSNVDAEWVNNTAAIKYRLNSLGLGAANQ